MIHVIYASIALAHGFAIGSIVGFVALCFGFDFLPWFAWTWAADTGLVLFNGYTEN